MSLTAIQRGDLVRVAGAHGRVLEKQPRRLQVELGGSLRWIKASEVQAHARSVH